MRDTILDVKSSRVVIFFLTLNHHNVLITIFLLHFLLGLGILLPLAFLPAISPLIANLVLHLPKQLISGSDQ